MKRLFSIGTFRGGGSIHRHRPLPRVPCFIHPPLTGREGEVWRCVDRLELAWAWGVPWTGHGVRADSFSVVCNIGLHASSSASSTHSTFTLSFTACVLQVWLPCLIQLHTVLAEHKEVPS